MEALTISQAVSDIIIYMTLPPQTPHEWSFKVKSDNAYRFLETLPKVQYQESLNRIDRELAEYYEGIEI